MKFFKKKTKEPIRTFTESEFKNIISQILNAMLDNVSEDFHKAIFYKQFVKANIKSEEDFQKLLKDGKKSYEKLYEEWKSESLFGDVLL